MNKHINTRVPGIWHGGDYNPDQWLHKPEIIDRDFELMEKAGCNVFSIGIFAWAAYEPREGEFHFDWMKDVLDRMHQTGRFALLSTPSGGRPRWLAQTYPEVLRVQQNRVRDLYGQRHNHCYTSPAMREKVRQINTELARRFGDHPAVIAWHISNEIQGECYCPLCQDAFREWLKTKYKGDLDALNQNYWSSFWAHQYTDWSQIEPFSHHGDNDVIHGINIDWKRFVTHQTADFFREECVPLRQYAPDIPITTNLMGYYPEELEKRALTEQCDFTSWDTYPLWHDDQEPNELAWGAHVAFEADYTRSLSKSGRFVQMEATPSNTNWQGVAKHKRPGMHHLASLQSVAHGADGVLYFQWRSGRSGCEKFHGSIVSHDGRDDTRVFQDVAALDKRLRAIAPVAGSAVHAKVALIFDTVTRWAVSGTQGFHKDHKDYVEVCKKWHEALWMENVSVDLRESDEDLSGYDLVIAPMLYALRPETADNLKRYVAKGGTLFGSCITGYVNENDLCWMNGFPGPLRELYGIRIEELDTLHDGDKNQLIPLANNPLALSEPGMLETYCERIHPEGADVLAHYGQDFYKDEPVLTRHRFEKGEVFYLAAQPDDALRKTLIHNLLNQCDIPRHLTKQPTGIIAQKRHHENGDTFLFVMNFGESSATAKLDPETHYRCLETGTDISRELNLSPYEVRILNLKK